MLIEDNYSPKFTFLIVKKSGFARFFKHDGRSYVNPDIGTVIDDKFIKEIK